MRVLQGKLFLYGIFLPLIFYTVFLIPTMSKLVLNLKYFNDDFYLSLFEFKINALFSWIGIDICKNIAYV